MMRWFLLPLLLLGLRLTVHAAEPGSPPAVRFDPVLRDIEGWKVHIEPALLDGEHRETGAKALAMLANHLQRIKILIPAGPLAKLQTLEIWIEHSHPLLKAMQYHPSKTWLVANKHDPRLARKVHVPQARELFSREQYLPSPVIDRDSMRGWEDAGRLDTFSRARLHADQLIASYSLPDLDPALKTELRSLVEACALEAGMRALPPLG